MFNRSTIPAKYKVYSNYIQQVRHYGIARHRNNPPRDCNSSPHPIFRCSSSKSEPLQKFKDNLRQSDAIQNLSRVLSSLQDRWRNMAHLQTCSNSVAEQIAEYKPVKNTDDFLVICRFPNFRCLITVNRSNDGTTVSVGHNVPSFCRYLLSSSGAKRRTDSLLTQLKQHKLSLSSVAAVSIAANEPAITLDTASNKSAAPNLDPIPEPPPVPPPGPEITDVAAETIEQINALGEPTFASLGLGGWTPVGIAQTCFEYLHVTLGIPWWEAIVLGTLVIRLCMFPLVVLAQRNAAKMNNCLPQLQLLQMKVTEARQNGNQIEAARYSHELMLFMKEKQLNPLKNMIVPLAQAPVFISFFIALRQMANAPVESLRDGGLWWFTDLTVPDQYFIMPLITSATLYATIELGTDSARLSSQNLQIMKYVLRALPLVILPFIVNFPGAILCYWVSTNFISLVQVGVLRIPRVRDYFKIEPIVQHTNLPVKPKGFTEGIKDTWSNLKVTNALEERRRLDDFQFQRAGKGPLVKTYKYDPTKQVRSSVTEKS